VVIKFIAQKCKYGKCYTETSRMFEIKFNQKSALLYFRWNNELCHHREINTGSLETVTACRPTVNNTCINFKKAVLISRNACYHEVQNFCPPIFFLNNIKIKILQIYPFLVRMSIATGGRSCKLLLKGVIICRYYHILILRRS